MHELAQTEAGALAPTGEDVGRHILNSRALVEVVSFGPVIQLGVE